jgi:hypothetical protein
LLAFDVAPEVVAWDNHVHREQDDVEIINCYPVGNDLRVVGVEVGVEELDVSFDGGAIGR